MNVEEHLRIAAARLLNIEPGEIDVNASLVGLGFDSLLAMNLQHEAETELGLHVSVADILAERSIRALANQGTGRRVRPALRGRRRPNRLPLSFAQQRLWLLEQLSPGAYLLAASVRIHGELTEADLADRLTRIVARHETLRTVFPSDETGPYQRILPAEPVTPTVVELPGFAERDAFLRTFTTDPFDLAHGPLFRAAIIDNGQGETELVLATHHIACDGWSLGVLLDELATDPRALPELPVQYADYTLWQRDWLRGAEYDRQVDYWRARLDDPPATLQLPVDRPHPVAPSHSGAGYEQILPGATREAVHEIAARHGVTTFMVVHAAYSVLLARLSGQTDVVVGTPVVNRQDPALDLLIGFFVNTLALRTDLSADPTFTEVLRQSRNNLLAAQEHQDLPLEQLVETLNFHREPGRNPLFQTMLTVRRALPEVRAAAGVWLDAREIHSGTAKFDLSLDVEDNGTTLALRWEYRTDLFDEDTIARFAGHFAVLTDSLLRRPDDRVDAAPMHTAGQRGLLLSQGDRTADATDGPGATARLMLSITKAADQIALACGKRTVTYREFEARTRRLAGRLRGLGVGPEIPVGLHAQRSIDAIIGLWAILRAGGAYVSLDPTYPAGRLALILHDAKPTVILSQAHLTDDLPDFTGPIIALDEELPDNTAALPHPHPGNLAYLLYTSGSTGAPKGVAVTHTNLAGLLHALDITLSTPTPQTWLSITSTAFDISVVELIWTLTTGATVILPTDETIPETVHRHRITHLQTTPSYATHLLTANTDRFTRLHTLLLGGEPLSPTLLDLLRDLPDTRIINGYGPTEATVYATFHLVDPAQGVAPIGAPLPGVAAHTLDHRNEPAPVGVVGRLFLSGTGIARGYHNNPRLTAQRFRPDPHGHPGTRTYDTGDLTHLDQTTTLHYHGRADHQTKINGYRIELGDITTTLTHHPTVADAHTTITTRDDTPEITTYLVYRHTPAPEEVTNHLRKHLPTWMHPTHLVTLPALPLNANGKIDTSRLPVPKAATRTHIAPHTRTERALAHIWSDLLDLDEPSIHDDFFTCGGHSLLATQAITRIHRNLGIDLPLRTIFDHPTIATLAAEIDDHAVASDRPALTRRPRPDRLPLSSAQRRLWFLEQFSPGGYLIAGTVEIEPAADPSVLAAVLTELVARHEALRTVFPSDENGPHQRILPPMKIHPATITADERDKFVRAGFNLAHGPLLRTAIIHKRHKTELVIAMHHITCDGWSLDLLLDQLIGGYARAAGGPDWDTTPPPPAQYADYTLWQQDWLTGPERERQLTYWRHRLANPPAALNLPTDRPRGSTPAVHGASHQQRFAGDIVEGLHSLAVAHECSLFTVLFAAYSVLISRLSGQTDIVVGTPVANRRDIALEPLVGFFANTLGLRAELAGDPAFTAFLGQARETVLSALDHQDLPFEQLVEDLGLDRAPRSTPVFQTMLSVRPRIPAEYRMRDRDGRARVFRPVELDTATAKFELSVELQYDESALDLRWEYRRDLFDEDTIARFAGHFAVLLQGIVAHPEARVDALPLLTGEERARLLNPAMTTDGPGATARLMLSITKAADQIALACGKRTVTYREFEARTRRLAGRLRGLGVGPEIPVGLHAQRSIDAIIGLWAILRAGGAYVSLDPTYPAGRLALILHDAKPTVILSQAHLTDDLPDFTGPIIALDEELPDNTAALPHPHPGNLAYLLYTSGSTGAPKGVAVTHTNLAGLLHALDITLSTPTPQTWLSITSTAFDISVVELIWTLTTGATVILPTDETIPETVHRHRITHLQTTPSYATHLLTANTDRFTRLHTLLLGGEPLSPTLLDLLRDLPDTRIINGYGPTEATVYATFHLVDPAQGVAPIGAPLPGVAAHTLDHRNEPAPVGVVGRLFLSGTGIARGYHNNPRLTAQRFRPDPHGHPGTRTYDTGDLTHLDQTTTLHYHGRADHQTKINGYRIELGDITTTLTHHPTVADAHTTITTRDDTPEITTYLVYRHTPAPEEVTNHLRKHLPTWMHPTHLVTLPALPLNANGKIDTSRLPVPKAATRTHIAPHTRTERALAHIWSDLLDLDEPSIHDDFFTCGGHSLLATQAITRIHRNLGIDLPLRTIFDHPTIATLAAEIDDHAVASDRPALTRRPRPDRLPLSSAQRRLWFLEQFSPGGYLIAGTVEIEPAADPSVLAAVLTELVARHEALRTVFPSDENGPHQRILPPMKIHPATITADERDKFVRAGFNLAHGPLLRTAIIHKRHKTELVIAMHHITCDGWSLDLLLDQLIGGYARAAGGPDWDTTPPPPAQYADYTLWQQDWLTGPERERQLTYWRHRLANPPAALNLPTDRPRGSTPAVHGASHQQRFAGDIVEGLHSLAVAHECSLFTVLFAAYSVLISRLSGQTDIVVGTPVANRTTSELDEVVGFLVNTLALRTDLADDPTFAQLLARSREVVLTAQDHQDLPFEQLVEELQLQRDHTRNPLFQAMLVLRHETRARRQVAAGVTFAPSELETGGTKVDLTLAVWHNPRTGAFDMRWEYASELFDATTVSRFAGQFAVLLGALIDHLDHPVSTLPLLTGPQRRQLIDSGRGEPVEPPDRFVHETIARQALQTPHAIALRDEDRKVTYAELDARADDLAAHLRGLGVRPDTLVGLYAHRAAELIVGMVAILRAGGAYVPLDPTYPEGRLTRILADARPPVVLGSADLLDALPTPAHKVPLDLALPRAQRRQVPLDPRNLAYVIYTSGSTGTPKGVAVTHANLAASTAARPAVYGPGARGFVLISSPAFDTSVASIFWSLCTGAVLHLPAERRQLELDNLEMLARRPDVSHLVCLPSLYRLLLNRFRPTAPGLDAVVVAGETVDTALVDLHHEVLAEVALYNEYGPTEGTVWSTVARCLPGGPDRAVPIGEPVPGVSAHVLEATGEPAPAGVTSELFLTGAGITRGYHNNPRLTAQRFRPDPHGAPGSRGYRTGDLARHDGTRTLWFRGRADDQLKIRGYRVEPAEIAAALIRHPAVRAAHAVVTTGSRPEIVAYLVYDGDAGEIAAHLATQLPSWMLPNHLVTMPALPTSPNGKLDAARLPAPATAVAAPVPPGTPLQRHITEVWQRLLDNKAVGIDHTFFELGGHSLLLVQACDLLRPLKPDLGIVDLFRYPTVRTLATYISGDTYESGHAPAADPHQGRARLRRRRRRVRADSKEAS